MKNGLTRLNSNTYENKEKHNTKTDSSKLYWEVQRKNSSLEERMDAETSRSKQDFYVQSLASYYGFIFGEQFESPQKQIAIQELLNITSAIIPLNDKQNRF